MRCSGESNWHHGGFRTTLPCVVRGGWGAGCEAGGRLMRGRTGIGGFRTTLRASFGGSESNCRHHDFRSCALPTELPWHGWDSAQRDRGLGRGGGWARGTMRWGAGCEAGGRSMCGWTGIGGFRFRTTLRASFGGIVVWGGAETMRCGAGCESGGRLMRWGAGIGGFRTTLCASFGGVSPSVAARQLPPGRPARKSHCSDLPCRWRCHEVKVGRFRYLVRARPEPPPLPAASPPAERGERGNGDYAQVSSGGAIWEGELREAEQLC